MADLEPVMNFDRIRLLSELLKNLDGAHFEFYVVSAGPQEIVESADALSILVPVMEDILGWDVFRIRNLFEKSGFILQEWEKVQTDTLSIVNASEGRRQSLTELNRQELEDEDE
jgi:hypothetical protein